MGAVCGKSSDFQGEGQKLGGPSSAPPTSTRAPRTLASSSPAAGRATGGSAPAVEAGRREAMAKAAEERNKSATKRGAPVGGKLSTQLAAMPADGGRTEEAISKGRDKGTPLVWD